MSIDNMGIRSLFSFLKKEERSTDISDPHFWAIDRFGAPTASNVAVNADTAMKVSTVFACVNLISSVVASLPLVLYKQTGERKEPATSHYLYGKLHDEPNSEQTSYQYREMIQAHIALRGNGYAYKEKNGWGRIVNLWPLNPSRMTVKRDQGNLVYEYMYDFDQQKGIRKIDKYKPEDIWHIPALSTDGVMGLSPVTCAREAIGLAMAGENFGAQFFGNKPVPGLIVTHPRTLKEDAKKYLSSSIQEFSQDRRHKVMVLEEGMEAKDIGITNEDSQFLESRAFQVEDICRFFNVPPFLVHHQRDKASTFASSQQVSLNAVIFCFQPWLIRWEQSANRALLTPEERKEGYFFKFTLQALMRGDHKTRAEYYAIGRQWGYLSANDCRSLEDMNPIEGGDEYITQPANIAGKQPAESGGKKDGKGTEDDSV